MARTHRLDLFDALIMAPVLKEILENGRDDLKW
jgi:hypothetical protein